jgi:serine/threonine-protein kinase
VHRVTHRVVAVKQLLEHQQNDPALRARLLREAEAIAAVSHPNIVQVLDAGEEPNGAPYLVLEYLEGRSLEGLITARGALHATDSLWILKEICAAMAAVHDAGVVHRDIKPSNVLVLCDGDYRSLQGARVKLLDFGIASASRFDEVRKLTRENALIGTLEYMPPERVTAGSDNATVAGDIYCIGATLFECLTGRPPFEGSAIEIVSKLVTSPSPSARSIRTDVPASVDRILEKALHRDASERYKTARELERALAAALEAIGTDALPAGASRRRHVRAPYITPVRLDDMKTSMDGRTEDLSANGLMVLVAGRPRKDAHVNVRFALPTTGEYVTVGAIVRWTREQDGRARQLCAVGLEFVQLDPRMHDAIEKFVRIVGTEVAADAHRPARTNP